jgi:hypothetical protein
VAQRRIFSLAFLLVLLRQFFPDLLQRLMLALRAVQLWSQVLHPLLCLLAVAFLVSPPPWVHLLLAGVQAPRAWLVLSPRYPVQAVLLEQLLSQGPAHFARERR